MSNVDSIDARTRAQQSRHFTTQKTEWLEAIAAHRGLPKSACAVAIALAKRFNRDTRSCWPKIARLADDAGMSTRHVKRLLSALAAAGYLSIAVNAGPNRANVYSLPGEAVAVEAAIAETETEAQAEQSRAAGLLRNAAVLASKSAFAFDFDGVTVAGNHLRVDKRSPLWPRIEAAHREALGKAPFTSKDDTAAFVSRDAWSRIAAAVAG